MSLIHRASERSRGKIGPHRELGRLLLQAGLITEDQLREALFLQRRLRERLASILVRQGVLTEKFAVAYLGTQLGVPGICLSRQHFDLDLLQLIPLELCEKRMVFPLRVERGTLTVAMKDPLDIAMIGEIERHRRVRLEPGVALEVSLRHTLTMAREALKAGKWRVRTDVQKTMPPAGQGREKPRSKAQLHPVTTIGPALVELQPSQADGETSIPAVPILELRAVPESEPAEAAAATEPAAADANAGPEKTVLLVHCEGPARSALERVIAEAPRRKVLLASTGAEAFALAADAHLLLVDASLPDSHGLDLCRRLHRHQPEVPILLLSATARGWRFAREARAALGITACVDKPFRVGELLGSIEAALGEDPAASPARRYARKHLDKGIAALLRDDLPEAQASFFRGLELDPSNDQLHYHAGRTFEKMDQPFEAIDHYEEAARLNPDLQDALVLLADLYSRNGFRLKSIESWERALEVTHDEQSRSRVKSHILDLLQISVAGGEPSQAA